MHLCQLGAIPSSGLPSLVRDLPERCSGQLPPAALDVILPQDEHLYRTEPLEDTPREVAFSALSSETQQALVDACSGRGALLLSTDRLSLVGTTWGWAGLCALCSAAFLLTAVLPFGIIDRGPREVTSTQGLFLGLCLGGSLLSALLLRRRCRLPRGSAAPGLYLFASDLVDTRGETIRIFPTSIIEKVTIKGRRILVQFARGVRFSLPRGELTPAELSSLRNALSEADARGDTDARRRLDPFWRERNQWHEIPACKSADAGDRNNRLFPLTVISFVASATVALSLVPIIEEQSDLRGVRAALARDDFEQLARYMGYRKTNRKAYAIADATLYQRARTSSDHALLLDYLKLKGAFFNQASDELFTRIKATNDTSLAHDFVRFSDGPHRDQIDQELFDAARAAGTEVALIRYAAIGKRSEEIRRIHLPKARLAQAFVEKHFGDIRAVANDPVIEREVRDEARAILDTAYGEARKRLSASTGLRTPFAQALDQALAHATVSSSSLLFLVRYGSPGSPYPDDPRNNYRQQLEQAFRAVIKDYIDETLLPLHNNSPDNSPTNFPESTIIKLFFRTNEATPPTGKPCRVDIEMSFHGAIPADRKPEVRPMSLQTLRFSAPHPDSPLNGRDFAGVAQQMLTKALLGEPPAWPQPG